MGLLWWRIHCVEDKGSVRCVNERTKSGISAKYDRT